MSTRALTVDPTVTADPRAATARGSDRAVAGRHAGGQARPSPPTPTPGAAGDLRLPMRFMAIGLATLALLTLVFP